MERTLNERAQASCAIALVRHAGKQLSKQTPRTYHEGFSCRGCLWALAPRSSFQIVTITNETEQVLVEFLLVREYTTSGWIGFSDIAEDEVYQWVTEEAVSYTHWQTGNPVTSTGVLNGVVLRFSEGTFRWISVDCSSNTARAIVEYDCCAA